MNNQNKTKLENQPSPIGGSEDQRADVKAEALGEGSVLADLAVKAEQSEETKGGELSGHGTHVSGTIGSYPNGRV